MVLPIMAYGNRVLRKEGRNILPDINEFEKLIDDMWQTLEVSGGVGLAAPQVNHDLKVFIVNSKLLYDELTDRNKSIYFPDDDGIIETFCNATILAESEKRWSELESCLSIPGISEPVERAWEIIVEYQDRDQQKHRKQFSGYTAKVIQHEYDHTQGILFIDRLPVLKKRMLKSKLDKIVRGKTKTNYSIKYLKKASHQ